MSRTEALPAPLAAILTGWLLLSAGPAAAVPVWIGVGFGESFIDVGGEQAPLDGDLGLQVGSLPPNPGNVTFDLVRLDLVAGGLRIQLDPALENPGLGVLNPQGDFLIPVLHLQLNTARGTTSLSLTDVQGLFGALEGCPEEVCLDVELAIDAGQAGTIVAAVHGVPEPSSLALLLLGVGLAAGLGREPPAPRLSATMR